MPIPDINYSTLGNIRTKVRRLTRSPSMNQISDIDIDNYVNTFIMYDFPEHLRMFSLRTKFTFFTQPFIESYSTNTTNPSDPLYNFKNEYISVHDPVYIAGFQSFYTQSREQFFGLYPNTSSIASIGTAGDGVTTAYSGTLSSVPVTRGNVVFSSVDTLANGLCLVDLPLTASVGNLYNQDDAGGVIRGTINYLTGLYAFIFQFPPALGATINSQTVPYVPNRPQAVLFYQDEFIVRPIPDQPYPVTIEAYIRPTRLLTANSMPELSEWWQYIAYGAAKKILEDRMDMDTVQMIMPEFKKQESLILRRALVQYSNERVATIYTEQTSGPTSGGFGAGGLY